MSSAVDQINLLPNWDCRSLTELRLKEHECAAESKAVVRRKCYSAGVFHVLSGLWFSFSFVVSLSHPAHISGVAVGSRQKISELNAKPWKAGRETLKGQINSRTDC